MIDIVSVGSDIGLFDSQTARATNILSVQVNTLRYAPTLGIDLAYFLTDEFRIQNSSFKAYLVQVLANSSINVSSVLDVVDNLSRKYTFSLTPQESNTSLVAR